MVCSELEHEHKTMAEVYVWCEGSLSGSAPELKDMHRPKSEAVSPESRLPLSVP